MDFGSDHDSVSQEKEKTFSTICDRKNNLFSFKIILFSFAKIKSFVSSSSSIYNCNLASHYPVIS